MEESKSYPEVKWRQKVSEDRTEVAKGLEG
jgi:hypothetical protein